MSRYYFHNKSFKLAVLTSIVWTTVASSCAVLPAKVNASPTLSQQDTKKVEKMSLEQMLSERKQLYDRMSAVTSIPWYRLAAIDQYERTMTKAHPKDRHHPERVTGIYMNEPIWTGRFNPDPRDHEPKSISFFSGYGRDGSGDGQADPDNDMDVLYSMAAYLLRYGQSDDDFKIALWEYYHNSRAVQRIQQFSKLYSQFNSLNLYKHAFPLPVNSVYSYRSTWGSGRNWGGFRIHEGTDLFAHHGLPVRSTCYGVVELKGWNKYGGWRIGIRDLENHYHYYAHLSGFDKTIAEGDIVTPGQTLGWVGSSGYGKPGTQGKFPPHLHYGIYRDSGLVEWSFDPYPLLHRWEMEERKALKKNTKGTS
ncbi:M23 family metallopeptidase [Paenibacillus pini]|uniref:Cell wall endopeptidase n=1 Tax=Paenibacillus pini JCM 16418 TaxID=1236976 RepID=W7YTP7_9BACL|nr:M23 family metallopeptidase [Paenibacillus pini]GAF07991.1 cell wall endopeptidase [Paenibacillus pini JCM 16418]